MKSSLILYVLYLLYLSFLFLQLYLLHVFMIAILIFIITVVQQWMKHYLIEVLKVDNSSADTFYIVFCLSAAPVGVIFGGFLSQKLGGYSDIKAMYLILFNTFICSIISVGFFFVTELKLFSIMIWLFLFFGSSIVPCIGGSILSTLPQSLKGSGYSLQNIIVNILGYSPAPYVYGYLYQKTKNTFPTLALSACMGTTIIGLGIIIMIIKLRLNKRSIIKIKY